MSDKMDMTDRAVMVAARLAAATSEPGDDAKAVVDRFADILRELRFRGGVSRLWAEAGKSGHQAPASKSR